jgi:hypothetical protein
MKRSAQLAPLTGLLGVAAVVAALAVDNLPDKSASSADLATYLSDHGSTRWFLMSVAISLGGTVLLVFASTLGVRVAEAGAGPITRQVVQTSATAWGLLTMLGGALFGIVPIKLMFYGSGAPSADLYHYLTALGYGVLVSVCAFAAALLALSLSMASRQTGLFPRWLTIAGFPAALLMLGNMLFPMAVITLYFVAVSIALTRRGRAQRVVTGAEELPVAVG